MEFDLIFADGQEQDLIAFYPELFLAVLKDKLKEQGLEDNLLDDYYCEASINYKNSDESLDIDWKSPIMTYGLNGKYNFREKLELRILKRLSIFLDKDNNFLKASAIINRKLDDKTIGSFVREIYILLIASANEMEIDEKICEIRGIDYDEDYFKNNYLDEIMEKLIGYLMN